ncbi:MAG TPA: hypothetical protein VK616_02310 [Flavitalea sp.]|nr:hypothetical protein [Flavitalea sp.]HTF31674.1 hypothetical protein [Flavitalea sp.]
MKTAFILILSVLANYSFSQIQTNFDNIKLEQAADYRAADSIALGASTYLLSTPFAEDNIGRLKSLSFVIRWMTGTPDYSFTLDEVAGKIVKGNDNLLGLYMAAMTKYSLENKESSKDQKLVKLNALTSLLNYCEDVNNNVKMTKQLKKLSEAKAKGQLEQSLK